MLNDGVVFIFSWSPTLGSGYYLIGVYSTLDGAQAGSRINPGSYLIERVEVDADVSVRRLRWTFGAGAASWRES